MEVPYIITAPDRAPPAEQKPGFWKRQFAAEATRSQIIFDVLYGVAGPVLCFVFDPMVFRWGFAGPPLLSDYQRKELLKSCYREITGEDIEARLARWD